MNFREISKCGSRVKVTVDEIEVDSALIEADVDLTVTEGLSANLYLDKFFLVSELRQLGLDVDMNSILDFVRKDSNDSPKGSISGYLSIIKSVSSPIRKKSLWEILILSKDRKEARVSIFLKRTIDVFEEDDFIVLKILAIESEPRQEILP